MQKKKYTVRLGFTIDAWTGLEAFCYKRSPKCPTRAQTKKRERKKSGMDDTGGRENGGERAKVHVEISSTTVAAEIAAAAVAVTVAAPPQASCSR